MGCSGEPDAGTGRNREVIVFAAASLAEAFTDIAMQFENQSSDTNVILNFAGSQQLSHQLSQGAPADVFASADNQQMEAAITIGRVIEGSQRSFTRNKLAVIYPLANPGGVLKLSDLARPGLKLVIAAEEVPAGRYTLAMLDAAAGNESYGVSFRDGVLDNIVSYEENVRAVLSKVSLGEADVGIVYASDLIGPSANKLGSISIPDELNMTAKYPIAPISNLRHSANAQAFIDFVLSDKGQGTLRNYGFIPIGDLK